MTIDPTLLDDLEWRGLIAHSTDLDALRAALAEAAVRFYVGFDPTAPSLHMGNLVQILTAKRLQLAGHTPYALVGGATGMIGDPRDSGERTLNSLDTVKEWVEKVHRQIEPFLDFEGANAATMVNNYDWTASLSTIDFLRDIGKHFPVNRMLARDVVQEPPRGRHQLHRVQLRAAAVDGLPQPLPRPRRDAAVRRQRPVGQPHRRRRADPTRRRRQGARVRDAAGHQGRRHQVRQDRGRRPVARPGDDVAVRLPPVLAQRRGREGRRAAAHLHVPLPRGDRGRSRQQTAEKPFLRAGQKALADAGHHPGARRRGDRARQGRRRRAVRRRGPARARRATTLAAALREAGCHARRPKGTGDRRPARGDRPGQEQGRGAPHDRRGRRLPQQRARRPTSTTCPTTTTCSPGAGWCCGAARRTSPASRCAERMAARRVPGAGSTRWSPSPGTPLPEAVFRYVARAPATRSPLGEAVAAWRSFRVAPRVLRDVTEVDTVDATCWARTFDLPFGIAPTTLQRAAHPDGEVAMARAAAAAGVPARGLEQRRLAPSPTSRRPASTGGCRSTSPPTAHDPLPLLRARRRRRAEAVVLTADTPVRRHQATTVPTARRVWDDRRARLAAAPTAPATCGDSSRRTARRRRTSGPRTSTGWRRRPGSRSWSRACSAPTTRGAASTPGPRAVWVSNHGGRQLDQAVATADAASARCSGRRSARAEVYVDGGVRSGLARAARASPWAPTPCSSAGRCSTRSAAGGADGVARALAELGDRAGGVDAPARAARRSPTRAESPVLTGDSGT